MLSRTAILAFLCLLLILLGSCARSYLVSPFPEQPVNNTDTITSYSTASEHYGGWVVLYGWRFWKVARPVDIYYNGRYVGKARRRSNERGTWHALGLKVLLSPGTYKIYSADTNQKAVTIKPPIEKKPQTDIAGQMTIGPCGTIIGIPGYGYSAFI